MKKKDLQKLSKEKLIDIIIGRADKGEDPLVKLDLDFQSILEAASDIIFVIDRDGTLIYRNSVLEDLAISYTGKVLGHHFTEYIPEPEKERARHVFDSVINDGVAFQNELIKTHDEKGNIFYFIINFSPIRSEGGDIQGLLGVIRNITESYLSEKKLKESSRIMNEKVQEQIRQSEELRKLRDLNEQIITRSPFGILTLDPSGIIIQENPAMRRILGLKEGETRIGLNLLEVEGIKKGGFDVLFGQCIREKRTMAVNGAPYTPISGDRELIFNVTLDPIHNNKGIITRIIVIIEDITEQTLMMKRSQYHEKLSSIGLLAAGVAWELKAPINEMIMDLNFLEKNIKKSNPAAGYVESLKNGIARVRNISEQLLSLSGADQEEAEITTIHSILANHPLDVMLARLTKDGFHINVDFSDKIISVKAAANQLRQIFYQLIQNAADAMPDKGRIDISITSVISGGKEYASIKIEDSGIGISPERLKKIFNPFFTTKGEESTGLGLLIVMTITEILGGTIGVKSVPGKGTAFNVCLPLAKIK
jgi:two-component system sporulation sensor kinase A